MSDEYETFLPNFIKDHDVLIINKKDATTQDYIQSIIEKYGPPGAFYIINIGDIIRRIQLWKKLFPTIDAYYAVKSNPNHVICELLGSCGIGADVASIEEINIVKNKVQDLSKIIFAHPVKPINSIVYARTVDVDKLVFDSEHELYKIKLHHPNAELFMRLKVDDKDSECRFSEKFGVEKDDIEFLLDLAFKMGLNVVGVSFHVGSNCKNPRQYYYAFEMAKYAFDVAKTKGYTFNVIDIGGGFSGTADEEEMSKTSDEVYNGLLDFFDYTLETAETSELKLISEPGRFFCTNSHTLVLNVIGKKVKIDKTTGEKIQTVYLNDGTYGSFSAINYDHQTPEIIPYNNDDFEKYRTVINGISCCGSDVICNKSFLPELEISDLVYVENFGSYTVATSTKFNGFCINDFYYIMN